MVELPEAATTYLRRLDRAARWLPAANAAELHEQITSHLVESLPPDAGLTVTETVLAELGDPESLVRDAADGRRRRWPVRLRRVRRTTWLVCGVLVATLVASTVVLASTFVPAARAVDLRCTCGAPAG